MKKLNAILYIFRSRNFILIHSIKEREEKGVMHKKVKVLRHTRFNEDEDKIIMKAAYYTSFKEVE